MRILLFATLLCFNYQIYAQDYTVNFDDRNETINLTNQALKEINDGSYSSAISILIKAISIDSTYRGTYLTLYKASVTGKIFSQSVLESFKIGTHVFKDDDEISFYMGELYRMSDDVESALKQYTQSINLSKINGEDFDLVYLYYFNRGNCYLKSNQFQLAIEDYSYSLNLKTNNGNVYTNRGTCYHKIKDHQKACDDWEKASELGNSISLQYLKSYCKQ